MKKTITALVLAVLMLLSLAACGAQPAAQQEAPAAADPNWDVVRPEGLPEGFPTQEIQYIYPFGTGSMQDVYIRVLAEKIKNMEGWSHGIVVQQKEGASGDIGWSYAISQKPDGYTLFFAPTAQQITAIGLGKDYTADNMEYIFNMMTDPGCVGVAADSPYNTLEELLEASKTKPVNIGVTSTTGGEGLACIQLQRAAEGSQLTMVPFDGEPEVLTAVAGGHCEAFCLNVGDCLTFLEDGSVKLLAVGTESRYDRYPDVPTYQESGYDVIQANSRAIAAPAGTDAAIVKYLSDCFMAAAASEDVKEQMSAMDVPYDAMDHETATVHFDALFESYMAVWKDSPWM